MQVEPQALSGLLLITPTPHADDRGAFSETFRQDLLEAAGFRGAFVQDNAVLTYRRGTVRGLHYQSAPHAQAKLVRVLRGEIYDVAIDIREGSPTFGRHLGVVLGQENGRQLLVPEGFAHGYQTLTDDCEVAYKVSAYHAPGAERVLNWLDPALGVAWPVAPAEALVNARDAAAPTLAQAALPGAGP